MDSTDSHEQPGDKGVVKVQFLLAYIRQQSRLILLICGLSAIAAAEGNKQLSVSPYFDSNVRESFNRPAPTVGIKFGGRYQNNFSRKRSNTYGSLRGQTYLDARFLTESKFLLLADVDHRHTLSQKIQLLLQGDYFHKLYFDPTHFYRWWDGGVFLQVFPLNSFTGKVGYRYRRSAVSAGRVNRFQQQAFEFLGRYTLSSHLYLEGFGGTSSVVHRDFKALAVERDTTLTVLGITQQDHSRYGGIHLRYQGKRIYGAQVNLESVSSNSVIGNYHFISLRLYLSGQWRRNMYYHLVLQQMDKTYQNPEVQGVSGYRDPEELIQNRSYLRLERQFKPHLRQYVQVSILQNETLLNQQFYDKILVEAGLKYEF